MALDPMRKRGWAEGFTLQSDAVAAWALAVAGARDEAQSLVDRLMQGPVANRYAAGIAAILLGRTEEGFSLLADFPQDSLGFLLGFLHDYDLQQRDPRIAPLLEQLGAVADFATLQRVRRGEKLL